MKTAYLNRLGYSEEKARSVDVVANSKSHMTYLIEFKNGDIKNEKTNIQLKIRDSVLIIYDICQSKISDTRENVSFVLVYNSKRSNLDWETKKLIWDANLSGRPIPYMGLDKVEGFIIKKAYILTKEEFEGKIVPKLEGV